MTFHVNDRVQYVGPPSETNKLAMTGTVIEVNYQEYEARVSWDTLNIFEGAGWWSFSVLKKVE